MSTYIMCNGSYLYIVWCNILTTPFFGLVSSMKSASVMILVLMTSVYASPIQRRELEEMASKSKLPLVKENAFSHIILTFSTKFVAQTIDQLWFSIPKLSRKYFKQNEAPKKILGSLICNKFHRFFLVAFLRVCSLFMISFQHTPP